MVFLHDNNISHNDLKPDNVLLQRDETTGQIQVKLGDFGLSRRSKIRGLKAAGGEDETEIIGTAGYLAPERLQPMIINQVN